MTPEQFDNGLHPSEGQPEAPASQPDQVVTPQQARGTRRGGRRTATSAAPTTEPVPVDSQPVVAETPAGTAPEPAQPASDDIFLSPATLAAFASLGSSEAPAETPASLTSPATTAPAAEKPVAPETPTSQPDQAVVPKRTRKPKTGGEKSAVPASVSKPDTAAVDLSAPIAETPAGTAPEPAQPASDDIFLSPATLAAFASLGSSEASAAAPSTPVSETPAETASASEPVAVVAPATEQRGGLLAFARNIRLPNFSSLRRQPAVPTPTEPAIQEPAAPVSGTPAGTVSEPAQSPVAPVDSQPAAGEPPVEPVDAGPTMSDLVNRVSQRPPVRPQPTPTEPAAQEPTTPVSETPTETTPATETAQSTTTGEPAAPISEAPAAENAPGITIEPVVPPTEAERTRERLIDRIAARLENTVVFGKPLPEFAFKTIGMGAARRGAKELAKGFVSWSGVAGAVGGGIAGTAVTGAFVGALTGAAVEYIRQVDANLSAKVQEADPELTSRKAIFLEKFKYSTHNREVFTSVNARKIGRAAIIGAITGAGAGALMQVPGVKEFLHEAIGNIGKGIGSTGAAGQWIHEARTNIGHTIAGEAVKPPEGLVPQANYDTLKSQYETLAQNQTDINQKIDGLRNEAALAKADAAQVRQALYATDSYTADLQNRLEAANKALAAARTTSPTPDQFVPETDLDAAKKTIAGLQQQLDAAQHVSGAAVPSADQVAAAVAKTAAEQAASHAAEAAQTQLHEAFANLNLADNYPLHGGDSVAGITENLGRSLGLTNAQIWELGQKMARENGITSSYYGTTGNVLDTNLPIGKVMNMQGVKALAFEMLKKKTS